MVHWYDASYIIIIIHSHKDTILKGFGELLHQLEHRINIWIPKF